MQLFHQARAAAALAMGVGASDPVTAAEAIYEAAHALEEPFDLYGVLLS